MQRIVILEYILKFFHNCVNFNFKTKMKQAEQGVLKQRLIKVHRGSGYKAPSFHLFSIKLILNGLKT